VELRDFIERVFDPEEIDVIIAILSTVKLGEELKKRSVYVCEFCQDLVLPGHKPYLGNSRIRDDDGKPFDFKLALIEHSKLLD
jgi:hypothetical protein